MKTTTRRAEKIAEMMDRDERLTARDAADELDLAVRQSAAEIVAEFDGNRWEGDDGVVTMADSIIDDARRALKFADENELASAVTQAVADYDDNTDGDADDEGNVFTTSHVNESTVGRIRAALK